MAVLCFAGGCVQRGSQKITKTDHHELQGVVGLHALLHEQMPRPVGFYVVQPENSASGKNTPDQSGDAPMELSVFEGPLARSRVHAYYVHTLAMDGWHVTDFSSPEESLFIADRPGQSCAISIRSMRYKGSDRTRICCFFPHKDQRS